MENDIYLPDKFEKIGDYKIRPCAPDFKASKKEGFKKMKLSSGQKMGISVMVSQLPAAVSEGVLSKSYIVKFPEGLPHTLAKLKQGGLSTIIHDGKSIVGQASLFSTEGVAAVTGIFSFMALLSGQYFLKEINRELKGLNSKVDKILEFLYGDKKAELMSEIHFTNYAYSNFSSIMQYEQQRVATLANLQNAKKTALKDMDFYLYDMISLGREKMKTFNEFEASAEKAFQTKECFDVSMQLYIMTSLLEIFYSQNFDEGYREFVYDEICSYVDRYYDEIDNIFTKLKSQSFNIGKGLNQYQKRFKIGNELEAIAKDSDYVSSLKSDIFGLFHGYDQYNTFYIEADGDIYIQEN